jgi:hypothetical protein
LGGEWVDIKNTGSAPVDLIGVDLQHVAYSPGSSQGHWEKVRSLSGRLDSGQVLRVHAGHYRDLSVLHAEDRAGAELHTFTGNDAYVWNNREGDTALLWLPASSSEVDRSTYSPNPPEGVVLVRSGSRLVAELARVGLRP